jgi:hypothetical protein
MTGITVEMVRQAIQRNYYQSEDDSKRNDYTS